MNLMSSKPFGSSKIKKPSYDDFFILTLLFFSAIISVSRAKNKRLWSEFYEKTVSNDNDKYYLCYILNLCQCKLSGV